VVQGFLAPALSGVTLRGVVLDPQAPIPFFLTHPVALRLASVAHLGTNQRDNHIAVVSTLRGQSSMPFSRDVQVVAIDGGKHVEDYAAKPRVSTDMR
jgi:hypothetical protein